MIHDVQLTSLVANLAWLSLEDELPRGNKFTKLNVEGTDGHGLVLKGPQKSEAEQIQYIQSDWDIQRNSVAFH